MKNTLLNVLFASLVIAISCLSSAAFCQNGTIHIDADLTDISRKLYHADIDIPVQSGPVVLTMAQWIPGDHAPNGRVKDLAGLIFTANGTLLPWRRDDVNLYAFHLTVPKTSSSVHVHVDMFARDGLTDSLAVLEWEDLMVYPAGLPVKDIRIQPSVKVPPGWGIGTSLRPLEEPDAQRALGGQTKYNTVTVEQLEDSPLITGRYFHEYAIAPDTSPRHFLDVVSDDPQSVKLPEEFLRGMNRLVPEAWAAYGPPHYDSYHFLLTLSSVAGSQGREHAESSNNGLPEDAYVSAATKQIFGELLPHEFTHSWNGKYLRPFGLYQSDFTTPQQGSLLWVYEGLTNYMGRVLSVRCGLVSKDWFLEHLASIAADLEFTPGRKWRSIEDTAIASSIDQVGPGTWANLQRGQDYYAEGDLFWLDVDTLIRQRTNGQKSLTDFLHIFLARGGKGTEISTYTRRELVKDLNRVLPNDWSTFIHERIDLVSPHADLAGIERGGYHLTYQSKGTEEEHEFGADDFWFSLGIRISKTGQIREVRSGSSADKAEVVAHDKIVAVADTKFSEEALTDAIERAKQGSFFVEITVERGNRLLRRQLDFHEGSLHPVLRAVPGTTDYLDQILRPLA